MLFICFTQAKQKQTKFFNEQERGVGNLRIEVENYASAEVLEVRNDEKLTVLYRPVHYEEDWMPAKITGGWNAIECALVKAFGIDVIGNPRHPEYLILRGHHSAANLPRELRRVPYLVWTVSGLDDERLPFIPHFA